MIRGSGSRGSLLNTCRIAKTGVGQSRCRDVWIASDQWDGCELGLAAGLLLGRGAGKCQEQRRMQLGRRARSGLAALEVELQGSQ